MLLFPNVGEKIALEAFVNKTAPQNLILKLYKNNVTPSETDVAGTFTESTFTGYSAATLTGSSWNAATLGAPSYIDYAQQLFTSSANQTLEQCYGYFLVQATSGILAWAERFSDGPYPIANLNDVVKVTPRLEGD